MEIITLYIGMNSKNYNYYIKFRNGESNLPFLFALRTSAQNQSYTYYIMNDTQKMKTKLRNSKDWKAKRKWFKKEQKIDPITLKPLTNHFNLHHRDLDEAHYCDLSNDDHFVALNPTSHDLIHFLFNIVKREQSYEVLDRIKVELQKMAEINLSAH